MSDQPQPTITHAPPRPATAMIGQPQPTIARSRRRRLLLALVTAVAIVALGCGSDEPAEPAFALADSAGQPGAARPVVQVGSNEPARFLDPAAAPRTDLGRLRARHLPVWVQDFDWAFPPEVCDTAWELDGIAEPTATAGLEVLGDLATSAALTAMRYEHQFSRALAEPTALAQLCVAAAVVGSARRDALAVLASYLDTGARRGEAAVFPDEVRVVGLSPTAAVAVACVEPGYPTVFDAAGDVLDESPNPARLQAYILAVSRGLEDPVLDVSYRVSSASHEPAEDCTGLDVWTQRWHDQITAWRAEGQIWEPLDVTRNVESICSAPPAQGPDECPLDWPK